MRPPARRAAWRADLRSIAAAFAIAAPPPLRRGGNCRCTAGAAGRARACQGGSAAGPGRARVAIVGLGRMCSTIDDEEVVNPGTHVPEVTFPYGVAASVAASSHLELVKGYDIVP